MKKKQPRPHRLHPATTGKGAGLKAALTAGKLRVTWQQPAADGSPVVQELPGIAAGMAKEAEHEAAQRREVFEIVARKSANSLAALERDGWRLVTPRSQGIAPQFRRRVGRRWEYLPALAELDRTDFATALSVRIFMHCDDALQAWSGGDMERAFAQAFLAGFYVGRSNAIVNESRRNATKRAGKGLGADIAAQYRAAIERAGRNATQHEILAQLPPELYESVATKTHLNRLTSVQKNLSREH